ncbi:G2E3 ligase, partial [Rhinopomastus cyanomelas]|nr:G2E3 ligase [Rhinopomastus cyanomelas]
TQPFPLLSTRSFCWQHRPGQPVDADPEAGTICLDPVESRPSFATLVCPVCSHAWFHRACIQRHAACIGMTTFGCPLCRDRERFRPGMLRTGISPPSRLPEWDEEDVAALSARHSQCDAGQCCCPGGREQAEQEGPWELLLCGSCAAEGTHRLCSHLDSSTENWECPDC